MQDIVPPILKERKHILFGNMQEIYDFHSKWVYTGSYMASVIRTIPIPACKSIHWM